MKIDDDELDSLLRRLNESHPHAQYFHHLFTALREAQELLEKFETKYAYTNTYMSYVCVYCEAITLREGGKHKSDCPYAIRERMGYGGQD